MRLIGLRAAPADSFFKKAPGCLELPGIDRNHAISEIGIDHRYIRMAPGMFEKTSSQLPCSLNIAFDDRTLKQPPFYIEPINVVGANRVKLTSLKQPLLNFRRGIAAQRAQ